MLAVVAVYRRLLAPLTWMLGARCRFEPSCSAYAEQAFRTLAFPRACRMVVWRLLRCHPWCDGGPDVLKTMQGDFPR